MRALRPAWLLVFSSLFRVCIWAQNQDPPLTLDRALAMAEQNSPQLKVANASAQAGVARQQTARAFPNPDFAFYAGPQRGRPILTPAVPGGSFHYNVTQPLELPNLRRTRKEAAARYSESSQLGISIAHLDIRAQVKRAFYDVLRRDEEIEHAKENLNIVDDLRKRTKVQVDVGEVGRLELTRAEAEVSRAQARVRSAEIERVAAMAALRALIGGSAAPGLRLEGRLNENVQLPALEQLRREVLEQHPVAKQAETEIQAAKAVLANEEAQRMPQPSLYFEYERQPDLTYYRVGAIIGVPVWNRRKGPIAEAAANLSAASSTAQQRRLELTAALERAYGQFQVADEQVKSFANGALRGAEAALQGAQAAYRFGERGIIEVLDAQRVLATVRADLLDAQYQRQAALIDLEELGLVQLGSSH